MVLTTPAMATRHAQQIPVSAPRCSRRDAKLPPEFDLHGWPLTATAHKGQPQEFDRRARASVARELGFSEDVVADTAGKDKYSKFFDDPLCPLCRRHVAALGACLEKVLPESLPSPAVIVVSP